MIGYGNSYFISTILDTESGTPPVNTVAPAITGTAQEGQTVSCSTGTWTGTPVITYAYQWKRNGSNIGSATNSTYTLVTADVGQSITCQVTATNGAGSASATSNTITPIAAVDPDAQTFITAASITDPTQQSAINQLVVDLKGYSIWTKMKAIYPFVGGTSSTHKWNLKDPRDLDAAFRLVFSGGWTHSSTGALPNGTNGWANTFVNVSTHLALNSTHISSYSRTNNSTLGVNIGNTWGGAANELSMWLRDGSVSYLRVNTNTVSIPSNTDSRGLFIGNRNSSTQQTLSIRGTQNNYNVNSNSVNSTNTINLSSADSGGSRTFFDNKEYAFASIGDGLTSQNMTDLTTIVNAFELALSRNV